MIQAQLREPLPSSGYLHTFCHHDMHAKTANLPEIDYLCITFMGKILKTTTRKLRMRQMPSRGTT